MTSGARESIRTRYQSHDLQISGIHIANVVHIYLCSLMLPPLREASGAMLLS